MKRQPISISTGTLDQIIPTKEWDVMKTALGWSTEIATPKEHSTDERPLIDQLVEQVNLWPHRMKKLRVTDFVVTHASRMYRDKLRKAARFTLDRDFVRMTTELAITATPKQATQRARLSTIPHETTWIEFNVNDLGDLGKQAEFYNSKRKIEKIGLLIEQDPTDKTSWAMTVFNSNLVTLHNVREPVLLPEPAVILFDPAGSPLHKYRQVSNFYPLDIKDPWGDDVLAGMEKVLWANMVPESFFNSKTLLDFRDWIRSQPSNPELSKMVELGAEHMYGSIINLIREKIDTQGSGEALADWLAMYYSAICRHQGLLSFLTTALALLNDVPIQTSRVEAAPMRQMRLKKMEYLDYHVVSLRLPKKAPIRYLNNLLNHAERKRLRGHFVRDHWRTYLREGNGACRTNNDHEWEYDYPNGYRLCTKCLCHGKRISEYQRGDATLGWVKKEYELRAAK